MTSTSSFSGTSSASVVNEGTISAARRRVRGACSPSMSTISGVISRAAGHRGARQRAAPPRLRSAAHSLLHVQVDQSVLAQRGRRTAGCCGLMAARCS